MQAVPTNQLRELTATLQAQAEVYRGLLAAVIRERDELRRSRATPGRGAGTEKDDLLRRLKTLEDRRLRLVEALAEACGCRADEVTVTRLAGRASAAQRSDLLRCRAQLTEITERVRTENRRTALMLEHAGELLQSSYRVLKGLTVRCGTVYRPGGRLQGARLQGKLLCSDV